MASQGWQNLLINSQVDGAALTASTTRTSLLPAAAKYKLLGGFFGQIGKKIRIKAAGRISNIVTTPGTLTLDIGFGVAGAVVAANGGAMTLSTTAKTNVTWRLEWDLTCRAIGASANLMHTGAWTSESAGATTVAGEAKTILLPQSAPAVGANFDSTADQIVDLYATWSLNNANSILCHDFELISLN